MIDLDRQLELFRGMLRIRIIEEKIAELYPEQEMRCPTHLSVGQESVPVAVCAHLTRNDYAMSGHRSHGHYLAKGGDARAMVAELYGRATGCSGGRGGSMHLVDLEVGFLGAVPIVSSTIPMAVGAAHGSRLRGEERLVVAFFGDAAVEEGVFHEAVNFAALEKLPVLFVCENNLYSVYSHLRARQPANRELFELARGHGVESRRSRSDDVFEVHALADEAVARVRNGEGPVFLEIPTYRWREHCGPYFDNDLGYRSPEEFEEWKRRCPIARARRRLQEVGELDETTFERMEEELQAEAEEAMRFGKESPYPDPSSLLDNVYAPSNAGWSKPE